MQQIIYFFQKFKYFLFFLLLECIALAFTFSNLNFHKSKFVNSANTITGGIYTTLTNTSEYLNLKEQNKILAIENNQLKNLLFQKKTFKTGKDSVIVDSLKNYQKYTFTSSKIIKNDYAKLFNFLLIDKGDKDGIAKEMAVINSRGIIGITDNTSSNYTRVQSILNRNSRINARLKNNFYFGTLRWDGKDYKTVQLHDIPRQASLKIGDTIETGGKSTIFPEGIPIGIVSKINQGTTANNKVDVKLFNDMSNLGYVYVIKNLHKQEIQVLENE
ncbi:rod shape-determining protein MreC [uncultured Polaribacter sp.]|uniref:rod shape-determining protein MreC n=1 Tax=uncultured Polaribacter sp. TaxID=174711 RepID=UPI0026038A34|nr:rod shape-determining protein MreC [uncultured Polaribacter sp.]